MEIGTIEEYEDYQAWCDRQVCAKCGDKYAERPRDEFGVCRDIWVTETLCGKCGFGSSED